MLSSSVSQITKLCTETGRPAEDIRIGLFIFAALFAPVYAWWLFGLSPILPVDTFHGALLIWRHRENIRRLIEMYGPRVIVIDDLHWLDPSSAGMIDETEARARRAHLMHEAEFHGAMDGASKFVRGDAIAGIIITFINILGGLYIGMVEHGWDVWGCMELYTKLTIGDGLVSQVPAFIISLGAGLIVTRTSSKSNLGDEMLTLDETAALLRVPENTLRYWRVTGAGPRSFKVGRHVRYWKADVALWLTEQMNRPQHR